MALHEVMPPSTTWERGQRTLCVASALLFFSQIVVAATSYYFGFNTGKYSILLAYGIYLTSFLLVIQERRWLIVPTQDAIAYLFYIFVTLVVASSLAVAFFNPSTALLRNLCYFLAFGIAPFLLGYAQNRESLERLMRVVFYAGMAVALITIAPSSWSFDPSYGRPIFLGADFLRLLLGPILGFTTLIGFYYAITAPSKTQLAWTLACSTLSFVALYFNVMRMAYYLALLLLMIMPLHLLVLKKISIKRAIGFVGVAFCLHLFSQELLTNIGFFTFFSTPDAYYGLLTSSHLKDLDWARILQRFSSNQLPLEGGHSAIGLNDMFDVYPNDSTVIRVRLYLEALMMFYSAPLLGVGASMFPTFSYQGPFSFPHSTLLHVAAELGSVGLVAFGLLLASATWRLLPHTLLLMSFLFFLAVDQTHGSYFSSWGSYFFIGVAASLSRQADKGHLDMHIADISTNDPLSRRFWK